MRRGVGVALVAFASLAASADGPAPGRMVDVGGHLMHFNCTGRGAPTVVVEGGLGDVSTDWARVQSGVGAFTRACTYDRAGYASSEPGPMPRTFAQINLELKEGLKTLGEKSPLVLVGHSFGGPVVRAYAASYPDEVAGMVLVDGVHEDQRVVYGGKAHLMREGAKGTPVPTPRLAVRPEEKATKSTLDDTETSQREWSTEYFDAWHRRPQKGLLGDRPLVVLTRAKGGYRDVDIPAEQIERERLNSQRALLDLSTNSVQALLDSGHEMHKEAPDAVVAAVRAVVDAVRSGKPVAYGPGRR